MQVRRKNTLPSWARFVAPIDKDVRQDPLGWSKEEASWMRTWTYHTVARQLDIDLHDILSAHFERIISKQNEETDLKATAKTHNKTATPSQTEASASVMDCDNIDADVEYFSLEAEARAVSASSLTRRLPVRIIQGPFSVLDESYWLQNLIYTLRRQPNNIRPCVVWLTSLETANTDWKGDIFRQCFEQELDSSVLAAAERIAADSSPFSRTDLLIAWASLTSCFDEIIIVTSVNDGLYPRQLMHLLQWLSDRRYFDGLPFSLILMGPTADRHQLSVHPSAHGTGGLDLKSFVLPTPKTLLTQLERRIRVNPYLSPLYHVLTTSVSDSPVSSSSSSSSTLSSLQSVIHAFDVEHQSICRFVMQLKQLFAQSLQRLGSFIVPVLLMAVSPPIQNDQGQADSSTRNGVAIQTEIQKQKRRLEWFLLQPNSREHLLSSLQQTGPVPSASQLLFQLIMFVQKLHLTRDLQTHFLSSRSIFATDALNNSKTSSTTSSPEEFLTKLLARLVQLREFYTDERRIHEILAFGGDGTFLLVPPNLVSSWCLDMSRSLEHCLSFLIVTVARCFTASDVGMVLAHLDDVLSLIFQRSADVNIDVISGERNWLERSFSFAGSNFTVLPQPRRTLISGLCSASDSSSFLWSSAIRVAGTLYMLILDVVSIAQSDWYALWATTLPQQQRENKSYAATDIDQAAQAEETLSDDPQETVHVFCCGVLQLLFMGLIRERRVTRKSSMAAVAADSITTLSLSDDKNILYEKTVMVWCSGDD